MSATRTASVTRLQVIIDFEHHGEHGRRVIDLVPKFKNHELTIQMMPRIEPDRDDSHGFVVSSKMTDILDGSLQFSGFMENAEEGSE